MIRKNKDSKFVIYQVLYIFVITVLAIKGADLDLGEVISKEEAVQTSVRDSLVTVIDSLNALGLKFDLKVDTNAVVENVELKEKIAKLNQSVTSLTTKLKEIPPPKEKEPEVIAEETKDEKPISSPLSESQHFIQNTWNIAKNNSNISVQIIDPQTNNLLASVLPGQQKKFDLVNQKEVLLKYSGREERVPVEPNRPPEIKIETVSSKMNASEIYVQELQKTTIFRVTIMDERPDQVDVTYSGPISVTGPQKDQKGNFIYNVSLRIAGNEARFDEWMEKFSPLRESDGRYKTNFFFIAVDKKTKDRVQVGDSFYFTDFSR